MTSDELTRRLVQLGGLFLIGNGLMGLLRPRWHALPWHYGPQLARAVTEEIADNPKTARGVYLAQAALGAFIVSQAADND
jgi:hypothetical protein